MIDQPGEVLLRDDANWLHFARPVSVVVADRLPDVLPALRQVQQCVDTEGLYAAGFIAYEASPAFDSALVAKPPDGFPLVWFGLYRDYRLTQLPAVASASPTLPWQSSISQGTYADAIARIKRYISAGDTYQVNFSYRLQAPFSGDPWRLFLCMSAAQQGGFPAYVNTDRWTIASASPELFFRLAGTAIESRPMKGTAARGLWSAQDRASRDAMLASEKERAENLMIVDMVRNDLGRIAAIGTVTVPSLFDAERYPTVWQMTSTVRASTKARLVEILTAMFPGASVTGAPKARTTAIIAELEQEPRHIYTGAIGYFAPGRRAQFNVAIRTLLLDRHAGTAEYGVGGGITWDSTPQGEYEECRTKARVLVSKAPPPFSLLESMLWRPQRGYALKREHLGRLMESAEYFGTRLDKDKVRDALCACADALPPQHHKVRLLVSQAGDVTVEAQVLETRRERSPRRVWFAQDPVDSSNPFLYHKTTRRGVYARALASRPGYDEVILFNERGEITEFTSANLAAEIEGELATPPVRCGLLPGTYRARMLACGRLRERVLYRDDVIGSDGVYSMNSVRGLRRVELVPPE